MRDVLIDDATWDAASDARQIEWEANIAELLSGNEAVIREDVDVLEIEATQQLVRLRARDAAGDELETIELPHSLLEHHIHEYVDVMRQIAESNRDGLGVARLEALDMAKKVTHDKAGRAMKRACRPLRIDHPTARRLFTLVLSLRVDTTRLHGVHRHRTIR